MNELKNVERLDDVEQPKTNTAKRVFTGLVAGATALAYSAGAMALDVSSELDKSTAKTDIETGLVWALGIAVVIYAGRKVIGFFSR